MPEIPLPPKVRAILYVVASILVPVYSVLQVSYASAADGQPLWLSVVGVLVGIIGALAGVTAVSHVPKAPDAEALD